MLDLSESDKIFSNLEGLRLRVISECLLFPFGRDQTVYWIVCTVTAAVVRVHQSVPQSGVCLDFDDDFGEVIVVHCVQSSSHDFTDLTHIEICSGKIDDDLYSSNFNVIGDECLTDIHGLIHFALKVVGWKEEFSAERFSALERIPMERIVPMVKK